MRTHVPRSRVAGSARPAGPALTQRPRRTSRAGRAPRLTPEARERALRVARGAGRTGLAVGKRAIGLLAELVTLAATLAAGVLALHVVFVAFTANPGNGIVRAVDHLAVRLVGPFADLFTPHDPRVSALVNFGLAAVAWLAGGRSVARLVRRAT